MTSLHASLGFIRYSIFKLPTEPAEVQVILCVLPSAKAWPLSGTVNERVGAGSMMNSPVIADGTLTAVSPRRILQWIEGVFGIVQTYVPIFNAEALTTVHVGVLAFALIEYSIFIFPDEFTASHLIVSEAPATLWEAAIGAVIVMDGAITKAPVVSAGLFTGQVVPVNVLYTLT